MSDGFLGRWARRKEAVREGKEVPPEPVVETPAPVAVPPLPAANEAGQAGAAGEVAPEAPQPPPPPTLEDTNDLTPASDFQRFMRPDVAPDVRNAAVKKLFADPHFNVMDRLDTYIDDYSQPDPIPPEMLRQLASAKFLNLFAAEEQAEAEAAKAAAGREVADDRASESVAQSGTTDGPAVPPAAESHADPDLRLQQDDAPGPEGPGAGPR